MVEAIIFHERKLGTRCCDDAVPAQISADEAHSLSDAMQLLAHPVRLQILDVLARRAGQVCVCDLEAAVPVKQPTVSHHLRLLREAGLVDCERHGQWAYYFVQRERLAAIRAQVGGWLATLA
jgi:ArsR family transcriptional regulator